MSKTIKLLIKDAKQAFDEKDFKTAEEKCHVSSEKVNSNKLISWLGLCQGILNVA